MTLLFDQTPNVNSSKFQDWSNLVLTSCKPNVLKICRESYTLEANLAVKVRLELEASDLQVQRFNHSATLPVATVIPWIGIYPVDSVNHLLNNWGLREITLRPFRVKSFHLAVN